MSIRSVVVATDFSADAVHALARGSRIARAQRARLGLVHVLDADSLEALRALDAGASRHAEQLEQRAREAIAEQARATGIVDVTWQVLSGGVVAEIARIAQAFDLLVVGAHGAGRLRDLLIGTTAERLLRTSSRPLLVVRNPATDAYRTVVAGIDFSADSVHALKTACTLAPEARITAVHAVELPFESRLALAGVRDADLRRFRTAVCAQTSAALHTLLDGMAACHGRIEARAPRGRPAEIVLRMADELPADLIALGKRGTTAVEETLLGSVVRHVLSGASCDVLVARAGDRTR